MIDKNNNQEYEDFMHTNNEPVLPISKAKSNRLNYIAKDLVGSKFKLGGLFFVYSFVGYILNLSFCAQGELGLTHLAHQNFLMLHSNIHQCLCALITGSTLTGIPFLMSFLFFNPFQRRYVLNYMRGILIFIPVLSTAIIFLWTLHAFTPSPPVSVFGMFSLAMAIINGIVWTLSAILTPFLLFLILNSFYKQKRLK